MSSVINNYFDNVNIKWNTNPFPHVVIDNFLPIETFEKISLGLDEVRNFKSIRAHFTSYLEKNKKVYGDEDLNENLKLPISILGGKDLKKIFENFLNIKSMTSLTDVPNYGGYYPFHVMDKNGFLGVHVDHGHNKDFSKIHVANSIYYASRDWNDKWGGETFFFNSTGTKIVKIINPIPNRLVLFIHSANSFHAVNKISGPSNYQRMTYYMDYYAEEKDLKKIYKSNPTLKYSFHPTTFIPFVPLGLNNFKIKYLFKKENFFYLQNYIKYLFLKNLFTYKFSKKIIDVFK